MSSSPSVIDPERAAIVSGGSSGIGLAVARQLTQKGCHVWLAARREDLLKSALKELEAVRVSRSASVTLL